MSEILAELARLYEDRQRLRDCIERCHDLGGKMLLMGKLKANYREEEALSRTNKGNTPSDRI